MLEKDWMPPSASHAHSNDLTVMQPHHITPQHTSSYIIAQVSKRLRTQRGVQALLQHGVQERRYQSA